MKFLLIIILNLTLFSCSELTKNNIRESNYLLVGGVYKDKKWDEKFKLNRKSWYSQLSLTYDVFFAKIDKNSNRLLRSELTKCINTTLT